MYSLRVLPSKILALLLYFAVATVIGTVVAFFVVPMRSLGADSWKIATALMGSYIGGCKLCETLLASCFIFNFFFPETLKFRPIDVCSPTLFLLLHIMTHSLSRLLVSDEHTSLTLKKPAYLG